MQENNDSNLSWETFWKNNPTGFNDTMCQSTLYFASQLDKKIPIEATDRILDIGCGPGFLTSYLIDKCEFIFGTDISTSYIADNKSKFNAQKNVEFSTSKPYDFTAYTDIITQHKINRVVVLSVLQYYENKQQIKDLLMALKACKGNQKFSCLLADIIPTKHSALSDIKDIISHARKEGYTFKFLKFLGYAIFSNYRKIKSIGMLQVDPSFFTQLGKDLKIDVTIMKNITLHSDRYSVLINF